MRRKQTGNDDFFSKEVSRARRFHLDLGPVKRGPLAVAAGGWEACSPDYVVERRDFPYYSVEFVAAGRGTVSLGGRSHDLVRGAVFSYGPGVEHRIVSDAVEPLEKYFVDFRGQNAARLISEAGLEPGSCLGVRSASRLAMLWRELLDFGTHPHIMARRGAVLTLELIMVAIAQERIELGGTGRARSTIDRCQAFLQENFFEVKTIEAVAEACHIDVAYLCRLYRRFLGETPYRVLQRLKMGWAAEQLLQPGKLVREVADGLDLDPFQFSRTFRRVYGVSPTEFVRLRAR